MNELAQLIQSRGTAPVTLLYMPEDCGCRAPTAWSIYLKIAVKSENFHLLCICVQRKQRTSTARCTGPQPTYLSHYLFKLVLFVGDYE